ncbi:ribonuclease toxin immunity protein CdiI [Listeria monocytogenes]
MFHERIKNSDLINEKQYPVKVVFDEISDEEFISIINSVSKGEGFGVGSGTCLFPGDLDEYDIAQGEGFGGVEFGLYSGSEIVIDYKQFYYYLNIICNRYVESYPAKKLLVDNELKKYQELYSI